LIPEEFKPKSIFHGKEDNFEETIKKIQETKSNRKGV